MRYAEVNDLRGNLILLTQSEQPIQTLRYSAFGEGLFSNSLSPWRYSGKRADPETGWIYFGRRYYEPQTGRWTTTDPAWFDDGPNLYAYVHNNPLKYFDPDGLSAWDFAKGALKEFGRSAATNLAAGGVLACAGSICPPLAGGMALAYTAYAVGTLTYDNRDLIADISSTFYNEGLYSGLDNISNKIGNEIERFGNLTDIDKGAYTGLAAALLIPGRKTGKRPTAMPNRSVGKLTQETNPLLQRVHRSAGGSSIRFSEALRTDWAKMSSMLRNAKRGKGNFGIGTATGGQALVMGKAWVDKGHKTSSDGKAWVSLDGMKQFRLPSHKLHLNKIQANFERRFEGQVTKRWQSNAHLDILD